MIVGRYFGKTGRGLAVAMALASNPTIAVISCPGRYDAHEGSLTGPDTIAFLGRFNANRAVIGASGLTAEGPNEVNSGAAAVKRAWFSPERVRALIQSTTRLSFAAKARLKASTTPSGFFRWKPLISRGYTPQLRLRPRWRKATSNHGPSQSS